jgi:hypothetical protein
MQRQLKTGRASEGTARGGRSTGGYQCIEKVVSFGTEFHRVIPLPLIRIYIESQ